MKNTSSQIIGIAIGSVSMQQQQSSNFIVSGMAAGPWEVLFSPRQPGFFNSIYAYYGTLSLESSEFSFNHWI